jgi:lipoyl synthase
MTDPSPLRVRWLGRVPYAEALDLQRGMFEHGIGNHLLLLEHPPVYTMGVRGSMDHVLVDPSSVGAELVWTDRGGDVTYHGPGQLVGYPILGLAPKHGRSTGMADTVAYVRSVEQVLIDSLGELGLPDAGRVAGLPGVWVGPLGPAPRKIAAIGVRLSRGRTMHGFALNVTTDLAMFGNIVPCGIVGRPVTSLAAEGRDVTMDDVVDVVSRRAGEEWGGGRRERQDVASRHRPDDLSAFSRGEGPGDVVRDAAQHLDPGTRPRLLARLEDAGVTNGLRIASRKPDWLRPKVRHGEEVLAVKRTMRDLDLVSVCEEAGCPNLSECWSEGTATFMILGERCTRACGFCNVDTRKPAPPDPGEPQRVAAAVRRMGLAHAVVTMVARDDLVDGGGAAVAATIEAIRAGDPATTIEVLISDLHGEAGALDVVLGARPEIVNHNIETVARLQRAVRPSAGYARSLALLARARRTGVTTKSGLIVGLGETDDEVVGALADLASVGVSIVTIGQYLRPTSHHLPVARWVPPEQFTSYALAGKSLGIAHVESSPLTRSSYHARAAAAHAGVRSAETAGAGRRHRSVPTISARSVSEAGAVGAEYLAAAKGVSRKVAR